MITLFVSLLVTVVAGGLIVAYVAFPQRGRAIPRAGWLSRAMQRLVEGAGLDPDDREAAAGGHVAELREQRRAAAAADGRDQQDGGDDHRSMPR